MPVDTEIPVKSDWPRFVERIANDFAQGKSGLEVSLRVQGEAVAWAGSIDEVRADSTYGRGLLVDMPLVEVRLPDGRSLVASNLFLPVAGETGLKKCRQMKPGDTVRFEARIPKAGGVFAPVKFTEASHEPKVYLELGLEAVVLG